jgi:threonine synthase
MTSYVTHLESALDGTQFTPGQLHTTHQERPLWVRYDLDAVGEVLTKEKLRERPPTLWRYRELLPPEQDDSIVTLGEGMTPLIPVPRLGQQLGLSNLWVKDEAQLPTGTFKSRGQAVAISMAKELGINRVAIPTAGNAGGAMAAYAARAGLEAYVFMPEDTPEINQFECAIAGAKVFLVNGLIDDCGRIVSAGSEKMGWLSVATLKEPYRLEGKKSMGLELAEQCNWRLPDVILYPTGGGTGLIGMWKAFHELRTLGWLESEYMPRMVAVQSDGCCPIVRAYEQGERFATRFENASTIASGLRVPAAVGDFMILDAISESNGCAVAVDEMRIREWMRLAASMEGLSVGPEAATCVGAAEHLVEAGWIGPGERVVIYNCGASQKYPDVLRTKLPRIDIDKPIDWERVEAGY